MPNSSQPASQRSIALLNQKGGVGKTTTAVNLAAGVSRLGRRVLLVDLDPQAHATLHLGVEPGDGSSVYDVLTDTDLDPASAVVKADDNLDLMPSEVDLAAVETELAAAPDRLGRLRAALAKLDGYDYVFLDCPPSLGVLTLNALAAVREVMIPMQAHFLALQGVGKLLETVSVVTAKVNPALLVTGVILTNHDEQTNHAREVVADLDEFFREARGGDTPWRAATVRRPAVRRNIKLAECPSFGQTIFRYAPASAGAADYGALADRLVREWDEVERLRKEQQAAKPEVVTRAVEPARQPTDA